MRPFKLFLGAMVWLLYAAPAPLKKEVAEISVPTPPVRVQVPGDNDLRRADYAERCLEEHLLQLRSGMLEEVKAGTLCWCCKEAHAWSSCPLNARKTTP